VPLETLNHIHVMSTTHVYYDVSMQNQRKTSLGILKKPRQTVKPYQFWSTLGHFYFFLWLFIQDYEKHTQIV